MRRILALRAQTGSETMAQPVTRAETGTLRRRAAVSRSARGWLAGLSAAAVVSGLVLGQVGVAGAAGAKPAGHASAASKPVPGSVYHPTGQILSFGMTG